MYTAVVLTPESQQQLRARFRDLIPPTWETICHHMTVNMNGIESGPLKGTEYKLNTPVTLNVTSIAQDSLVMAVGVETLIPSTNSIKHITLAVNRAAGGKPFLSNKLTVWTPTSPLELHGVILEE